jgi:crotonobetaine/carnitine-CoA ligase
VLPLYHLSATVMGWACVVAAEAAFALAPRFSRSGFWPLADASGATVTLTVPTVVEMLLTEPPSPADRSHPLRLLITHRPYPAFTERFGVEVACLWGMTETSGMGLGTRPGATSAAPGLIGTPYPPDAEVRLLDPTGKPVPRGTPGELFFRHPAVMLGYFREGTSSYGSPGQPVRSGDLALQDDEGNYHYVGRLKNMIKRGGENVSGEEVERHIAGHPQVAEVVVVPVPDPVYVEEVCAVVYPLGTPAPGELADSLVAWCATRLPDWKTPRYFVVRDEPIPKLGNQKFDRKTLMAQMAGAALIDRRADAGMPAASDQSLRPQDHRVAAVPARNQGVRT